MFVSFYLPMFTRVIEVILPGSTRFDDINSERKA